MECLVNPVNTLYKNTTGGEKFSYTSAIRLLALRGLHLDLGPSIEVENSL